MSGKEKGWKFPSNNGGEEKGFNDAGIESYAGTPFESVAREVIQNSLDASLKADLSSDFPVTVSFEYVDVSAEAFPSRDELLPTMKKCYEACKDEEKAEHFFQEAQKILQQSAIGCLKISDSNTTGMRDGKNGDLRSGQWWGLVKKSGTSKKSSDTAGGSFGIGKHAPFVVSALRTVFYSTRYTDESGVVHQFAQGKSILVSHEIDGDEASSQSVGFYGIKEGLHRLENDIPKLLHRDEDGSTLLIAGLKKDVGNWRDQIIAAVISNYFYAIDAGWLKVSVDASDAPAHAINADKLEGFFAQNLEIPKSAHYYYRAIKRKPVEGNVEGLGKCKLWILQEEGAPQGVAILRRGMQITDEMRNLGRHSWRACSDFAAVFMCDDDDGNALLRGMENPTHDKFDFDRLLKKEDKIRGKEALKNLRKWVKDKILEVAGNKSNKVTALVKMADFFGYPEEGLSGDQDDKDFDGGSHIEGPNFVRVPPISVSDITDNDIIEPDPDPDPDPEPGPGPGPGPGPSPVKIPRAVIPVIAVRILPEDDDGLKKRVMFTPTESADAILCLNIAGDSYVESEHVEIMSVEGEEGTAIIEDGKVRLTVNANVRISIHVALSTPVKNDALHLLVEKHHRRTNS